MRESNQFVVGSYIVGFGPEELRIGRYDTAGNVSGVFTRQQPRPKAAPLDRDYLSIQIVDTLGVGDAVVLAGTNVLCVVRVNVVSAGRTGVRCLLDRQPPVAGEFRTAIDESGVIVRQVVTKRVRAPKSKHGRRCKTIFVTNLVFQRQHGS